MWLARWLSEADADCLRDDGISDYAATDMVVIAHVDLIRTKRKGDIEKLKRSVERELRATIDEVNGTVEEDGYLRPFCFIWEWQDEETLDVYVVSENIEDDKREPDAQIVFTYITPL